MYVRVGLVIYYLSYFYGHRSEHYADQVLALVPRLAFKDRPFISCIHFDHLFCWLQTV